MSGQPAKVKRGEAHHPRRIVRLGIALVIIAFIAPLLLLSLFFGMLHSKESSLSPERILVAQPYENTQAFTILQEQLVPEPRGTLFLIGWHRADASACIGLVWIAESSSSFESNSVGRTNAECPGARYSVDQFWGMRSWQRIPFSVAYGYSGAATKVVVDWQDHTRTELKPVNGSYLALNPAKSRVIESVEFYSGPESLLYRFPDSARSPGPDA